MFTLEYSRVKLKYLGETLEKDTASRLRLGTRQIVCTIDQCFPEEALGRVYRQLEISRLGVHTWFLICKSADFSFWCNLANYIG